MQEDAATPLSPPSRYSAVAITLHWIIALLILDNIVIGLRMESLKGLDKFVVFQWHKSIGLTVLLFSLARLAWRLTHRPPPYPADLKRWERVSAHAVHWLFYVLMIGLPLTGWIIVSASPLNLPTRLYNVVPWPHIGFVHHLPMAQRKAVGEAFESTHVVLAFTAIALIVLHVGAALKHQFWDKDGDLWRMAPLKLFRPASPAAEK